MNEHLDSISTLSVHPASPVLITKHGPLEDRIQKVSLASVMKAELHAQVRSTAGIASSSYP